MVGFRHMRSLHVLWTTPCSVSCLIAQYRFFEILNLFNPGSDIFQLFTQNRFKIMQILENDQSYVFMFMW